MKSIKRLIILSLLCVPFCAHSQENRPQKDRAASLKIGFLTDRLDLTPEEAKLFWPVYGHFQDELELLPEIQFIIDGFFNISIWHRIEILFCPVDILFS